MCVCEQNLFSIGTIRLEKLAKQSKINEQEISLIFVCVKARTLNYIKKMKKVLLIVTAVIGLGFAANAGCIRMEQAGETVWLYNDCPRSASATITWKDAGGEYHSRTITIGSNGTEFFGIGRNSTNVSLRY
jgi:hypothetical protein